MSIKRKLMLVLFVPLFVIGAFSLTTFCSSWNEAETAGRIERISALAVRVSSLVHETQKERGRTAGFLGSKGVKFKKELDAQRELTDERITELEIYLRDFDLEGAGDEFKSVFNRGIASLSGIKKMRSRISDLEATLPEALGYYTGMNGEFLDSIGSTMKQDAGSETTTTIAAYMNFLKGKERAGIERAVLSNTFAGDKFGAGMYEKFISLTTQQSTYLGEFEKLATDEALAFYKEQQQDAAFAQVENYRQIAKDKAATGGFNTDAGEWFSTITTKINRLKDVENFLSDGLLNLVSENEAKATTLLWEIGIALPVIASLIAITGIMLMRSITLRISALIGCLKSVAEGDLTQRVEVAEGRVDELGQLGNSFNTTAQGFHDLVQSLHRACEEFASSTCEIAASSEEIVATLKSQNQQTEDTDEAVGLINISITAAAKASENAASNAQNAMNHAGEGGTVVDKTVESINSIAEVVLRSADSVKELDKHSEQISAIIGVINEIAEQTNLLALNAAIEAARAGVHGRGFAIVADEVRKLAERTSSATEEVAESIQAIQKQTQEAVDLMSDGAQSVEAGVNQAEAAGEALGTIVKDSTGVSEDIRLINDQFQQQSSMANDVTGHMEHIKSSFSETEQATEQAAIATTQLSRKAEELLSMVSEYQISA